MRPSFRKRDTIFLKVPQFMSRKSSLYVKGLLSSLQTFVPLFKTSRSVGVSLEGRADVLNLPNRLSFSFVINVIVHDFDFSVTVWTGYVACVFALILPNPSTILALYAQLYLSPIPYY